MRKLASIRVINEIVPIEGADKIVLAKIDGWQTVVKKGEFKPGDKCVYFEIDSLLPIRPEFDFLRKCCYVKNDLMEGYRLKTVRLRGQISQGLALPLHAFGDDFLSRAEVYPIGKDVTEELGVKKFEKPVPASLSGIAKGNFPSFVKKTDLERIQNFYKFMLFRGLHESMWEVTHKLDGSSMTVYYKDGDFGVCSRNIDLVEDDNNIFWKVANRIGLRETLSDFGKNMALQGELVGPGIQGNPLGLDEHEFYLFDIWNIDNQEYYTPYGTEILYTCNFFLRGVKKVPTYELVVPEEKNFLSVEDYLEYVDEAYDKVMEETGKRLEGLVFKHATEPMYRFKVISNKYLLNGGE